ncbi:MAG: NCS2 family permease [Kiritimatiellae bacterium]|nr:NCS2 family permease [Kiritimatiellia bacterium]
MSFNTAKRERTGSFAERAFGLAAAGTTVRTELVAGLTTFMTMAYILAVNPSILSAAGMPRGGVFVATALAAFAGTLLMAVFANYPFVLAPGMGLNAFLTYGVVMGMGYSWQFALLAVFVEGLVFLALSVTPVREGIFNAVPASLKKAVSAGIGLFICFIALQNAHIVVDNGATLVDSVDFRSVQFHTQGICAILALVGTVAIGVMLALGLKGAILFGILLTWLLGMFAQATGVYVPDPSNGYFPVYPDFSFSGVKDSFAGFGKTFGAIFDPSAWTHGEGESLRSGWTLVKSLDFFVVMFAFFFVDLFDTLGTLIGVSLKGGMLDKNGRLPRISGALYADSIATSVGAIFGTSTTTTFVESASGVAAGGRTGLTAITAAVLFLASILLAPVFLAIPAFATAPALVVVGYMMLSSVASIDWKDVRESLPAFVALAWMPFTYSISDGIMFGIIAYTLVNAISGKAKNVSPVMYALTAVFIVKYAFI